MKAMDGLSRANYSTDEASTQVPFRIDPEFANKIPPIGEDEFRQLRENILAAGEVYEPLVVWNGILVDGHNRWKVIQENDGIKWSVREAHFDDKWSAFEWMYRNQLGRRNLTDEQRTYTIGKMKQARMQSRGNNAERGADGRYLSDQSGASGEPTKTRDIIAKELGIGSQTVDRADKFAQGVDALREVNPEAADKILAGNSSATRTEVSALAKSEPKVIEEFAKAINAGEKPPRPKRPPKTEEERRDLAEIQAIVDDMYNPDSTPEFTVDMLIEDMELNAQTYIDLLKNTLRDRKNLITAENTPRIVETIHKIAREILRVRDSM